MTLISDIKIGERHRQDMGDLVTLANSIKLEGLLQPIGVTPDNELVFGYRRLIACRDHLGRVEIETRVVNVTSIAAGEYAENEVRKNFTVSERVALVKLVEKEIGNRQGQRTDQLPENLPEVPKGKETREIAVKLSGLGNTTTARQAAKIVEDGIPELVAAVDRGELAIEPGFAIALQPAERQAEIIKLPIPERRAAVNQLDRPGKKIYKPKASATPIDRSAMFDPDKYRRLKPLSPELSGYPVGPARFEQDPDSPPGVTRAIAHITKHGMVQTVTPQEHERQLLHQQFVALNALLRQLVIRQWPTKADLLKLDDRRRDDILSRWNQWTPKIRQILNNILDP